MVVNNPGWPVNSTEATPRYNQQMSSELSDSQLIAHYNSSTTSSSSNSQLLPHENHHQLSLSNLNSILNESKAKKLKSNLIERFNDSTLKTVPSSTKNPEFSNVLVNAAVTASNLGKHGHESDLSASTNNTFNQSFSSNASGLMEHSNKAMQQYFMNIGDHERMDELSGSNKIFRPLSINTSKNSGIPAFHSDLGKNRII
jgi:hypothetical protein